LAELLKKLKTWTVFCDSVHKKTPLMLWTTEPSSSENENGWQSIECVYAL